MDYTRKSIWDLREIAREQHPDHTPEAARVFVDRILEMESDRRTIHLDARLQGYGTSPIVPGYAPGGTDIAREPLAALYDKGIKVKADHEAARAFIEAARLPQRQLLAALLQARKQDRRADSKWGVNFDQMAANLGIYAQELGFASVRPLAPVLCRDEETGEVLRELDEEGKPTSRPRWELPTFKTGKAITSAATNARAQLLMLAKMPAPGCLLSTQGEESDQNGDDS